MRISNTSNKIGFFQIGLYWLACTLAQAERGQSKYGYVSKRTDIRRGSV
jgi:hypothetical protein